MKEPPENDFDRIPISFHADVTMVGHGGEVVYVGADLALVDARTWPPTFTRQGDLHVAAAARSASGRWLLYVQRGFAKPYQLFWYDSIASRNPSDDPCGFDDPVPARDFSAFYDALPAHDRDHLEPQSQRAESLHVLGELPVVVPLHVGLDDHKRPLVRVGGRWTEIEVPPYEREPSSRRSCATTTVRLSDGTDVLGWDGRLYASRRGRLELLHAEPITTVFSPWKLVPTADGVFTVDHSRLVELGPRGRIVHLPGRSVRVFSAGSKGTLLVHTFDRWLLYDPARDHLISLDPWFEPAEILLGATDDHIVAHDPTNRVIRRVQLADVLRAHRTQASAPPIVAALPIVDDRGAVSRAQIASSGTELVTAYRNELRHHAVDIPDGFVELGAPAVAVARSPQRAAALDGTGTLYLIERVGVIATLPVVREPRTLLSTDEGSWLVVGRDASAIVDPDGRGATAIGFVGGLAAAIDPGGAIVLVGDDRRLALYDAGTLADLPGTADQVIAIAPLGGRRFVCAGQQHLFVLDLAHPELEIWIAHRTSPHLASDLQRRRVAFAIDEEVFVANLDVAAEPRIRVRIASWGIVDGSERRIHGVHFLDDGRLAVALPCGAGIILDLDRGKALRMDPHPGDPASRFQYSLDDTWFGDRD